jgi:hypothetical protein
MTKLALTVIAMTSRTSWRPADFDRTRALCAPSAQPVAAVMSASGRVRSQRSADQLSLRRAVCAGLRCSKKPPTVAMSSGAKMHARRHVRPLFKVAPIRG